MIPSDGVLCQSSSARNSDWPDSLDLVNRCFTVFTAFSAFALDCGWYGGDVVFEHPSFCKYSKFSGCELGAVISH